MWQYSTWFKKAQDGLKRSNKVQGKIKLKGFMKIQNFEKVPKGSRGFQKARNVILKFQMVQKDSKRLKKGH